MYLQFGNPNALKRPIMTAEPSIVTRELRPQDLFVIFASDGLWELLSDQEAVNIVYNNPRAVSAQISLLTLIIMFVYIVVISFINIFLFKLQISFPRFAGTRKLYI